MTTVLTQEQQTLANAVQLLQDTCHTAAKGWWTDKDGVDIRTNPYTFSNKLMLIVTEIAEACEADRKDLMDDHLPHLKGIVCELADAAIRISDLCGAYDLDLGSAIAQKLAYNAVRADHKKENREAVGGKSY